MRKFIIRFTYAIGLLLMATFGELMVFGSKGVAGAGEIVFLVLLNMNIIAIASLLTYLGRTLYDLFKEFRQRTPGYRFKSRLMAFFLILTLIPTALLFLAASGLGSTYIDRLFSPDFRRPIESAVEIARKHYETERLKALEYAELARSGYAPPSNYSVTRLAELPPNASASVQAAFEGRHEAEVITRPGGDLVRAALPLGPAAGQKGIIIVEATVPLVVSRDIEMIVGTYEDYLKLEAWKSPLKLNYLLLLGFFTTVIIFAALFVSHRIAGWITEPIKRLAGATEAVAAGNLSVTVETERKDEMGMLVDSFNRMVTELRDSKESLQRMYLESDRRRLGMENIVENITSGVVSLDGTGRIIAINTAACGMLDVREDEVKGKFYTAMLSRVESEELRPLIKSVSVKSFRTAEKEIRVSLDGARKTFRVTVSGLHGEAGNFLGLLIVFTDMTDVVKAQRALAWQEVAKRMAHEIKNPLTPIKLSAERMLKKWDARDEGFGKVFERSAKTIVREVDSLKALVDEFSRLGKMPALNRVRADLGELMAEVAALYRDYKGLSVTVAPHGPLPPVELDREQFKRMMLNLMDNAIKAMHGKGTVTIGLRADKAAQNLTIEVADDGPGISDEDKEKLFLPYFSTTSDGTGLGLAIADRIVAEHEGHISVRDNDPRGSVFTIELPIKEEA